jgi:hypothetical protein
MRRGDCNTAGHMLKQTLLMVLNAACLASPNLQTGIFAKVRKLCVEL